MNIKFDNVYIENSSVVVGNTEKKGPLSNYFDDYFECNNNSFEQKEILILKKSIDLLLSKLNYSELDINLAIGGELSNQIAISSYTMRDYLISNIGIYSACSTICLAIGLAGICLNMNEINKILVFTSSYNQTAEKQFRNPIEYGGNKEETQTFTSTVGASCIVSNNKSKVRINSFTIGKVIDVGFMDSNDFGRAMTPAAIETLLEHFKSTNTNPNDYDLILTGDLSKYGHKLVKQALEEEYGVIDNYNDCGLMLYDINFQDVLAGGSGPGTAAAVGLGYIYKCIEKGVYNKVLLCATGALMNPTMVNQKNSIPCIAHAIEMEREI